MGLASSVTPGSAGNSSSPPQFTPGNLRGDLKRSEVPSPACAQLRGRGPSQLVRPLGAAGTERPGQSRGGTEPPGHLRPHPESSAPQPRSYPEAGASARQPRSPHGAGRTAARDAGMQMGRMDLAPAREWLQLSFKVVDGIRVNFG
ncbi:hypothetical protein U0070_004100 [Myodes glareolus]|uniref:Uncharacterized protein n=1 Tax=Myodes glareolus TaxID=447135 RepID=A0AAW0KBV8_MYOGA